MDEYMKETKLQGQNNDGYEQFKVSVPIDFVRLLGWEKGDILNLSVVLGGRLSVEKKKGDE